MSLIRLWRWWFAFFAPAFGGGGSSSSSSSNTQTTNVDKRLVVDGQSVGVSSDSSTVNVTATDYGSVDRALQIVREANANSIDLSKNNTQALGAGIGQVLGFAEKALTLTKENIGLAVKNTDQISTAYKTVGDLSTGNRTLATLGLIVGGIVAVVAFTGGKLKG